MTSNLSNFMVHDFGVLGKKSLPKSGSLRFSPRSFTVLALTFKSMICFELILEYCVRQRFKFFFLLAYWISNCSSDICWKAILPIVSLWHLSWKSMDYKCLSLFLDSLFFLFIYISILMLILYSKFWKQMVKIFQLDSFISKLLWLLQIICISIYILWLNACQFLPKLKDCWNFDMNFVKSVDQFGGTCYLNNTESSNQ